MKLKSGKDEIGCEITNGSFASKWSHVECSRKTKKQIHACQRQSLNFQLPINIEHKVLLCFVVWTETTWWGFFNFRCVFQQKRQRNDGFSSRRPPPVFLISAWSYLSFEPSFPSVFCCSGLWRWWWQWQWFGITWQFWWRFFLLIVCNRRWCYYRRVRWSAWWLWWWLWWWCRWWWCRRWWK